MPSLPQPQPSDDFRRTVADLYGDRDTPATPHPAWPQAVEQVSTQLCEKLRIEVPTARLHKALELVLAHAVTLHADGSASVLSGTRTYTLAPHCPCPDAKNRSEMCKHALAVELHRRRRHHLSKTNGADAAGRQHVEIRLELHKPERQFRIKALCQGDVEDRGSEIRGNRVAG